MNYSYQPKPQNRADRVIPCVMLLIAVVCFTASSVLAFYPAIFQMVGFAALVALVYTVARGQLRYIYYIEPDRHDDGAYDLVIAELRGARRTVVCRLALGDVREIDVATHENKKEIAQKYKADRVHAYFPGILPAQTAYVRFADSAPGEAARENDPAARVVIRIAPDETLLDLLRHRGERY